ncbi:WD40-repeat-containing domain protein [Choanephora cucurbitarum]|nr:WD40-repeat-containing domain protein [Choanephora cucurbitarum]
MPYYSIKEYSDLYEEAAKSNIYSRVSTSDKEWKTASENLDCILSPNELKIVTGISTLKTHTLMAFQSIDLSKDIKYKRGFILNVGFSIWGLDFIPKVSDSAVEYLAIGGYYSTEEHHMIKEDAKKEERYNMVQIWEFPSTTNQQSQSIKLAMCILHKFGPIAELKWAPCSAYDEQKLGIVAILFVDGSIRIFVIPHPNYVRSKEGLDDDTITIQLESPRLCLETHQAHALCLSWGGQGKLACGTTSGMIVVWDILGSLLEGKPKVIVSIPNASQVAIRCISWGSLFGQNTLFSSDFDGNILLHDLDDPHMPFKMIRRRTTFTSISGTGHSYGFLFSEADGLVRRNLSYIARKAINLNAHSSHVWSISVSPHHGVMASVSSNGSAMVKMFAHDEIELTAKHKNPEYTLYKLIFDNDTQTFRFVDGIKPNLSLPERAYHTVFAEPCIALQKIAWNPNKNASGWIASGGKAGLCRIEFTGCT